MFNLNDLTLILLFLTLKSLLLPLSHYLISINLHDFALSSCERPLLGHLILRPLVFFICIVVNHEVFQLLHVFFETELGQGLVDIGLDNLFPLMFLCNVICTIAVR